MAIPVLLYLSFKKKYRYSIPARFFLKNNPRFEDDDIWIHACSLGEVVSLAPIIDNLKNHKIDISVITQTGYKRAKEIDRCSVRYLPFEFFLPFWIKKHKTLVVVEAELWPMLFVFSKLRGIKTILINARISDNSYSGYLKFSWFYRWIFAHVDKVFAQSQIDKQRLQSLGAKSVEVFGNIKNSSTPIVSKHYAKPNKRVIVIASSHEGEEALVLKNLNFAKNDILIVVPRHPERFESVQNYLEKYAKKQKLSFSKLSEKDDFVQDIVLCDKMGELINLYAICDIVILCGSFIDGIGGHNPIECAYFNTKIISGPYIFNQKALFPLVENIKISEAKELGNIDFNSLKNTNIKQLGQMKKLLNEIGK